MRSASTSTLAVLATGFTLALAGTPAFATQPMLFSQTATSAQVTALAGHRYDVLLRTGHKDVVAFEERPGTRTATLTEEAFTGLWRGTFRTDAPNAVLTGRGANGRDYRAVVRLQRASRVAGGVRYRVRVLRGSLAASLSPANLTIDSVPLTALTLARRRVWVGPRPVFFTPTPSPAPLSIHLNFPTFHPVVMSMLPTGGSAAGGPLVMTLTGGSVSQAYAQFTFYDGGQVIVTGNPGAVTLAFSPMPGPSCALPAPVTWATQIVGSDGSIASYGPGDVLGASSFSQDLLGGTCFLRWSNLVAPPPRAGVTYSVRQVIYAVEGGSNPIDWPSLNNMRISAV